MKRHTLAIALAGMMVLAGACSGDDAGDEPTASEQDPSGSSESEAQAADLTTVVVGSIPITDAAPLHYAVQQGYFEAEGLDVQIEAITGGAEALPSLLAGDFDIIGGNQVSYALANIEGIGVTVVAEGTRPGPGSGGVMVPEGSDATTMADLAGQTVAVNTLQNSAELAVKVMIDEAGGDPTAVSLTEIPFPDMPAAIAEGRVDGAFVVEPFVTAVLAQGGSMLAEVADSEALGAFPQIGYAATTEWVEANADAADRFVRALGRASDELQADPELVRGIVPTYSEIPEEVAANMGLPTFVATPDLDVIQETIDIVVDYGILPEAVDASEFVRAAD
jgi:NitT/TauT family transport system substrate-binding protein